jgi:hypothetical protein
VNGMSKEAGSLKRAENNLDRLILYRHPSLPKIPGNTLCLLLIQHYLVEVLRTWDELLMPEII